MKKFILLILLTVNISAFASTRPLKIINNTQYTLQYMMTTTNISATEPIYGFPLYRMSALVNLAPYSSILYDDPGVPGLPFNLIPGTWDYYPTSWGTHIPGVTGSDAYRRNGLNQKWASVKFTVFPSGSPSTPITSGHIGPFQGSMYSGGGGGVTITWIPGSGGAVTIVLN